MRVFLPAMKVAFALLFLVMIPRTGSSAPAPRRTPTLRQATPVFAVVVGVNQPPNKTTQRLRYADDDAILFHRVFATVGESTLLIQPLIIFLML